MGILRELSECKEAIVRADRMLELIEYRLAIPGALDLGLLPEEIKELKFALSNTSTLSQKLDKCIEIQERLEGIKNDTIRH